jgi:hypothetical protein
VSPARFHQLSLVGTADSSASSVSRGVSKFTTGGSTNSPRKWPNDRYLVGVVPPAMRVNGLLRGKIRDEYRTRVESMAKFGGASGHVPSICLPAALRLLSHVLLPPLRLLSASLFLSLEEKENLSSLSELKARHHHGSSARRTRTAGIYLTSRSHTDASRTVATT